MIEKDQISRKILPEEILKLYDATEAYVAKIGFIPSNIREEKIEQFWGEDRQFSEQIKAYINDLFALISASPHVMEVTPTREEFIANFEKGDFSVSVWPMESIISLDFIKLRMIMPKRKRQELGVFQNSWSPDEFNIAFNGSIFLTYAPIQKIPVFTDLGQIAREYLSDLMSGSKIIEPYSGIGPTPIHPEIYIVKLKEKEGIEKTSTNKIPTIKFPEGKIVILIPDEDGIEDVLDPLLMEIELYITGFYAQRLIDRSLSEQIESLEEMNELLSEKLVDYFELTLLKRFFSKKPKEIRYLLASMHSCLQEITSSKFHAKTKRDDALKHIDESIFFSGIKKYFDEHMEERNNFDRESQLTSMNFAADETSNFILTQSTLVAALAGALIGGAITSLSQLLTK